MSQVNDLIKRLDSCPPGKKGWVEFEKTCVEVLKYLFSPAISLSKTQARTYSGIARMDAVFANRHITLSGDPHTKNWHHLYLELAARMILFEFKNYDTSEISQDEVNQIRNYMHELMGRLAIIISNKRPNEQAYKHRNSVYTHDKKVVLLITKEELKEMLAMKERGEDPSDLIIDMVEQFYIQYE